MADHIIGGRKEDVEQITKNDKLPKDTPKNFLENTTVEELFPENRTKLITVDAQDSISEAFKVLIDNRILSAPCYDSKKRKYTGFFDVVDVVVYTIKNFKESEIQDSFNNLLTTNEKFTKTNCGSIANLSGRNPYYTVDEKAPLFVGLSLIVKHGLRRLAVVSAVDGSLSTIVTQSHVSSLIETNAAVFESVCKETLAASKVGIRDVLQVKEDDKAYKAFEMIDEKKISGVAVVSSSGELLGNISGTDLQTVGASGEMMSSLLLPAKQFVEKCHNEKKINGPLSVTSKATLEEVLLKLKVTGSHRLYIVDDKKLVGVVTLRDFLEYLTQKAK